MAGITISWDTNSLTVEIEFHEMFPLTLLDRL